MLIPLAWSAALAQDPPAPDAKGPSVSVNESFQVKYRRDPERLADPADVPVFNYVEQINRIVGNVTTGAWTFSVQVDEVALFANRYFLDDELEIERDLVADGTPNVFPTRFDAYANPEKVRAEVQGDWGVLTLGDAYAAFGRGIALNLNRNVDIDVDTSIQGAKTVLRPGAWDVTVVAGQTNRQQVFQENPNAPPPGGLPVLVGDWRHLVAGARAERFGLGPANLGAHGVLYDFVVDPGWAPSFEQLGGPDVLVGGATVELVGLGGMDFYVEGDLFGFGPDHPSITPDAPDLGYGTYASASAYPGAFVVLLEGKRYFQAERVNSTLGVPQSYEVAVAPTLEYERAILEDTSAALNSDDIWGARLETNWAAIPGKLSPYVAMAVFRDLDLAGIHFNNAPETIYHPMVGTEWIDGEYALLLNAGYRVDDRDGTRLGADRQTHGDLSANFPLPAELAGYVSLSGLRFQWGVDDFQHTDFVQAETAYSLTWASKVTGTFSLDTTTDPVAIGSFPGNVSETLFAGGELQVKPSPDLTIKAFYGAQKAGIRCAGGQCRKVPGFDGAKLSVAGTF